MPPDYQILATVVILTEDRNAINSPTTCEILVASGKVPPDYQILATAIILFTAYTESCNKIDQPTSFTNLVRFKAAL